MTYVVQRSIPYYTGLPTDVVTNTFHYNWIGVGTPTGTDFNAIRDSTAGLYEQLFLTAGTITMAPWLRPALSTCKIYNLDDPEPRVPVYSATDPLLVAQGTVSSTPLELSCVLSYQGTKVSGTNQASRRGRLYIGGMGTALATGTTTTFPTWDALVYTRLASWASSTVTALPTSLWQWVVYSRKLSSTAAVTNGWIDNAYDTQRRRGNAATSRTLW